MLLVGIGCEDTDLSYLLLWFSGELHYDNDEPLCPAMEGNFCFVFWTYVQFLVLVDCFQFYIDFQIILQQGASVVL